MGLACLGMCCTPSLHGSAMRSPMSNSNRFALFFMVTFNTIRQRNGSSISIDPWQTLPLVFWEQATLPATLLARVGVLVHAQQVDQQLAEPTAEIQSLFVAQHFPLFRVLFSKTQAREKKIGAAWCAKVQTFFHNEPRRKRPPPGSNPSAFNRQARRTDRARAPSQTPPARSPRSRRARARLRSSCRGTARQGAACAATSCTAP